MRRRTFVVLALLVQVGVLFGVSGPAVASPPLVGTTTCSSFTGAGTFSHKLTATGHGTTVKIRFRGLATDCTPGATVGGLSDPISAADVRGSGTFVRGASAQSCSSFEQTARPDAVLKITMIVTWAAALPAAPSTVTYQSGPYGVVLSPIIPSIDLDLGLPATPTTVVGSFAGSLVQNTIMDITSNVLYCPVPRPFVFTAGTLTF